MELLRVMQAEEIAPRSITDARQVLTSKLWASSL